mgnify:CR=1 FL=1
MDEHAFDQMLKRLMKQDFAAGTEAFRDALLERCLTVLGERGGTAIDDADLDQIAGGSTPLPNPTSL